MTTVAVMQPYFVPYAGYFRLFAAADIVVSFDCVQFPRRGWVHRNRFLTASGETAWLTLPLRKVARDTLIRDLAFQEDAAKRLDAAIGRFPMLLQARKERNPILQRVLELGSDGVAAYLSQLVDDISRRLGFERKTLRSSTLCISPDLKAQDRVIAIVKKMEAGRYINPPGGRALYDRNTFAQHGIDLKFLTPYTGSNESILSRMLTEPLSNISEDIAREAVLVS